MGWVILAALAGVLDAVGWLAFGSSLRSAVISGAIFGVLFSTLMHARLRRRLRKTPEP
jgi:membrane associated rhomboid family serine protease